MENEALGIISEAAELRVEGRLKGVLQAKDLHWFYQLGGSRTRRPDFLAFSTPFHTELVVVENLAEIERASMHLLTESCLGEKRKAYPCCLGRRDGSGTEWGVGDGENGAYVLRLVVFSFIRAFLLAGSGAERFHLTVLLVTNARSLCDGSLFSIGSAFSDFFTAYLPHTT